jgi:hypothetical protein
METFGNAVAYKEALGLSKVWAAYAENCSGHYIESVGFYPNSGYVYISLESGVQICSCLGQDVEYVKVNSNTGEETSYETYDEAYNSECEEEV